MESTVGWSLSGDLGRREIRLFAVVVIAVVSVGDPFGFCEVTTDANDDLTRMGLAFLVSWMVCLWLLVDGPGGIYRPAATYLVLFGLFHGGLLVTIALRGPDAFSGYDSSWIYDDYTATAVRLVITCMAVATLVVALSSGRPDAMSSEPRRPAIDRTTLRRGLAVSGLVTQFVGVAIFLIAVGRVDGTELLSGGYSNYVEANLSEGVLGYGTLFAGIGPVFTVVAGGRARLVGWTTFAGYALLALLIGARGPVLFPLLTLLVIEARLGRRPRRLLTVAGAVGLLTLIGLVRLTRQSGLSALGSLASPMDAVAEMGYSLRPTVVVLNWHSAAEPFRGGETLIAVPLRFIENLTGWHGGQPAYDDRLFNIEIMDRVGPIGGSPIAEGYHNFGEVGTIVLMAVIGLVLGLLQRVGHNPLGHALVGVVLLPLLVQVRNSFAAVPAHLALGLLLVGLVHVWSREFSARAARAAGTAHPVKPARSRDAVG
jgi:oligosaccharide repeat unit polymerase